MYFDSAIIFVLPGVAYAMLAEDEFIILFSHVFYSFIFLYYSIDYIYLFNLRFHIWENFFHIHHKAFWIRAIARLPLCGSILLIAVAFPFFGPINSVLGAFTTSFATYIIPLVAFNLVFNEPDVVDGMSKPLPKWAPDIHWVRYINWLLALVFLIGGVGIGVSI